MNCGGVSPDQRGRPGGVKVQQQSPILTLGHLIEERRRLCTFFRDCWKTVGYFDSQRGSEGWRILLGWQDRLQQQWRQGRWNCLTICWTPPRSPFTAFLFTSTVSQYDDLHTIPALCHAVPQLLPSLSNWLLFQLLQRHLEFPYFGL